MAAISKWEFETTVARHWQGDRLAYRQYLVARNRNALADELAGREQDRQIAAGTTATIGPMSAR